MNLKNYYWYFESALSPKLCAEILKYGKSFNTETAVTGNVSSKYKDNQLPRDKQGRIILTAEDQKDLKKKRNSDVTWLDDKWIYKELHPFVEIANINAGWNFQWDYSESCQFTKYSTGQYYGWHCDSWQEPYKRQDKADPTDGKIRKISMTVSLSDPSEYEGGNLEFDFRNNTDWDIQQRTGFKECTEIRTKGSIVIFPSFVWHRVKPVTKGKRYSLVIWNLGYPFR